MNCSRCQQENLPEECLEQNPNIGRTVSEVFSWAEIPFRQPGALYGIDHQAVERAWICYVDDGSRGHALKSSTIIVVSKETGHIVYTGSAYDEG